jgi:hypothetical protein
MMHREKYSFEMSHDFTFELLTFILLTFKFYSIMNAFRNQVSLIGNLGRMPEVKTFEPKFILEAKILSLRNIKLTFSLVHSK